MENIANLYLWLGSFLPFLIAFFIYLASGRARYRNLCHRPELRLISLLGFWVVYGLALPFVQRALFSLVD